MANLSAITGTGGVKNVTHFTVTNGGSTTNFSGTVDITSAGLSSTSKAILIPGGVSTGDYPAISINSTTQVVYSTASTGVDFSFSVLEYN